MNFSLNLGNNVKVTFLQLASSVLFLMAASCFFFFLSWAYLRCSICSSSVSDDGKCRNTIANLEFNFKMNQSLKVCFCFVAFGSFRLQTLQDGTIMKTSRNLQIPFCTLKDLQ